MLTEPILSHESEYPFPVVPTILKLAGQGTSDSADSRTRLVLYEPAHSGSITHLVDTIDRHHIDDEYDDDDDDDARKRTEEGEGYSGIPVCREFPNENPNIYDSLAYSTLE
ncbi:hypothetical protein M8J77_008608 [Diaphorina citri]|nr:hypothetical protein M8J77_008608 [Diaphorina citri]